MRLLTVIAIVQLVLLGLLFARIVDLERRIPDSTATPVAVDNLQPFDMPSVAAGTGSGTVDEDRLRQIVREELEWQFARAGSLPSAAQPVPQELPMDPQMALEYEQRREAVSQRLDYFSQVGRINEAEMVQLQTEIARLRPEDRDEMLKRLFRHLNTGAIDGRL